jgi:hypothetical protein
MLSRQPGTAEEAVAANVEAARRGAGFAENAIEICAQLGALDEAFAVADAYYLGRGFSVGPSRYSAQQGSFTRPFRRETKLLFSPSTGAMRRDPRFGSLVGTIGLTDYWRRSGAAPDVRWAG